MEGKSKQLLPVGREEVELIDGSPIISEALLSLLLDLLERAHAWSILGSELMNEFLNFVRVTLSSKELSLIAERDVLETMNLTEGPEDGVRVLAKALDLEDLTQVGLLGDALHHVIEELGLGERVLVVHRQVVEDFILR